MVARRRVYPYAHTSHDKRITATVNGHKGISLKPTNQSPYNR